MKTWDAIYQEWQTDDGQIHAQRMGLLIRCKECKKWKTLHCPVYEKYVTVMPDEFQYCSWAQRRTNEID